MFGKEDYEAKKSSRIARNKDRARGKIEGIAEGISVGIAEGFAEGITEGKIESAVSVIENLKITVGEAMRIIQLPKKEQKRVVGELKKRGIPYVLK